MRRLPRRIQRAARVARALLGRPGAGLAVMRAWVAGKRLRARQQLLALAGAEHRLELPPAWRALLAGPPEAESAEVEVRPAGAASAGPHAAAPIVILTAAGHALVPGARAAVLAAFRQDPVLQVLYGDSVAPSRSGDVAVLRPAFDPDQLLSGEGLGPVVAVRREMLDLLGLELDLKSAAAADLALRVAESAGEGAVRHLPRILGRREGPVAPEPAAHAEMAGRALRRAGLAARLETCPDGMVRIRRPLPEPVPLATLIVPTRDRVDLLRTCLTSLRGRTDWARLDIVVVDNDSRDPATLAYLREIEASGAARILRWPGPFDFAAMNNAAARQASEGLLGFINNDVEAYRPDWLQRMAAEALRPEVGAVGAKLVDADGRIQHGGIVLGTGGGMATHAHRFFPGDAPGHLDRLRRTHRVAAVTAACLVVEARKFHAVGGFDAERFAVDFNDVDLCLRLDDGGWRTLMVPEAVLHHREAASRHWTPEALARHEAEVARFRARWGDRLTADRWYHPGFDPELGTYVRLRPTPPKGAQPR